MFLINCLVLTITYVNLVSTESTDCGNWVLLGDKKCIKIIDKEKVIDYENGIKLCETENSNLITIHSEIEQKFIEKYLFKDNKIVDNIWIGLKNENGFKWSDKSSVDYTNWADKSPINNAEKNCVQISTEGSLPGKWVNGFCNKKAVVVCQKTKGSKTEEEIKSLRKEIEDLKARLEKAIIPTVKTPTDNKTLSEETKKLLKEIEDLKAKLDNGVIPTIKTPTDKTVIGSDVTELTKELKRFHSHYDISKPFRDFDNKNRVLFIVWNNTYESVHRTDSSFYVCETLNSHIMEIRSNEKQEIVDKQITLWNIPVDQYNYNYFWLNGKRDTSGKWKWESDKSEFRFTNWGQNYPTSMAQFIYNYMYHGPASGWLNAANGQHARIICEREVR